ncbi:MAG: hypothetical protein M3433_07625 [Actinomycetota bacterium]|nr:hypothetical protein [Actinomycetota bacterium]
MSTALYTLPLAVGSVGMVVVEPITIPVALATAAHAWMIPELYAFRGASVVRPKRLPGGSAPSRGLRPLTAGFAGTSPGKSAGTPPAYQSKAAEAVAQGLLGDLLDHDARELQRETGLALEPGRLGTWLLGEAGALLITPRCAPRKRPLPGGGRRVHCFCVGVPDPELPPSDRVAHLLLALRTDEEGFATVANHAFCGAPWRVRRRLPKPMRPALDAARRQAR